jgi:Uma2 family endonuclease
MNSIPERGHLLSVERYLAEEAVSVTKHEYVAGQLFAMTGTSVRHNRILTKLGFLLHGLLESSFCEVFMADVKVHCYLGRNDLFY